MNLAVLVMIMNYLHDLASGLLFGSVAAYFLAAGVLSRPAPLADAADLRVRLFRRFRPVVLGSLALVVLGGIPRMIFYHDYEWLPAAGRGQIAALVVKHVVLVSITALSLTLFFVKRPSLHDAPPAKGD